MFHYSENYEQTLLVFSKGGEFIVMKDFHRWSSVNFLKSGNYFKCQINLPDILNYYNLCMFSFLPQHVVTDMDKTRSC